MLISWDNLRLIHQKLNAYERGYDNDAYTLKPKQHNKVIWMGLKFQIFSSFPKFSQRAAYERLSFQFSCVCDSSLTWNSWRYPLITDISLYFLLHRYPPPTWRVLSNPVMSGLIIINLTTRIFEIKRLSETHALRQARTSEDAFF